MTWILIIALVILMGLVLYSLVRGIVAFLQSTKIDLETGEGENVTEMQLLQNKMMFNRIKYQALAIVVVAILLAISQ
ncbi:HIG1 domain-containing protein [Parerythrobacter aestuarii]|uniref:HIG1 domain-containing protein n=1 Tax=Parerythrobacter aestuarii TaxID=3020909 RepID=UPI0024DE604E|nr:HIG1 domain-containing protein [Parerythrobacter aestuarii]